MAQQRNYVGQGKVVGDYGNIRINICLEDCEGYSNPAKNGKHYINLIVANRMNPDERGNTKSVYIDEYKPDESKDRLNKATREEFKQYDRPKKEEKEESEDIDVKDIPF